jgi:single-strand DNA-binding protein
MKNINHVTITGRLTRDPELRALPSGSSVCSLRIANNTSRKNTAGEWEDRPNYFDVTVWNGQGEAVARYLSKGSRIAIDGRLEWREWDTQDDQKRQAVQIVADHVEFLDSPGDGQSDPEPQAEAEAEAEQSAATGRSKRGSRKAKASQPESVPAGVAAGEGGDDIPF